MSVGMNLDWIADYEPAWMFKDAFQKSRTWQSYDFNTVTRAQTQGTHALHADADGWPTQLDSWTNDAGQLVQQRLQSGMFGGTNAAHPAGTYRAEWAGTGTVNFLGDATVASRGDLPDGRHFANLTVTPTNAGIFVRLDTMDSANPIRDMHVWMPDYNGESIVGDVWRPGSSESPFHPLFLERLRPFDTLRFMQTANTITSDEVNWSDRRPVTAARQAVFGTDFQNGLSIEYQIELANELHKNVWFNMPHMANDDYVRNYATLVRDTLDPSLIAYVEWSNELWNWAPGFEPHYWARAQADAEGVRIEEIVARETVRDFDIWSQVFAGQEGRIVRTVGGFHASPGAYGWNANVLSRMNGHFDALAVAPYISPPRTVRETYTTSTTVDQVIADTQANIAPVADLVRRCADMLRQYEAQLGRDLKLVTYEGGTHLDIPNGAAYRQAFFEAAVDPRMHGIVTDYLHAMENAGVDLFNYYKFTDRRVPSMKNSDFGTLSRMDQDLATAPRYRALVDFIGEPDPPPVPNVVTIVATDASAAEAGRDPAVFTVTRTGGSSAADLTVSYAISGTATNGTDYDTLTGRVTIPADQASATVTVRPIDDPFVENSETVILTLLDADTYDLGSASSATATIISDDVAPALPLVGIFASDGFAAERNLNVAVFTVRRTSEGISQPLTLNYSISGTATNGSDYQRLSGTVTIPAGAAGTSIVVTPIDDSEVEPRETVILTLQTSPNYRLGPTNTQSATATIDSDDVAPTMPTVTVAATDANAAEAGRDPGLFTFTRAGGNANQPLVVNYTVSGTATSGSDFATLSGSVTIPAGRASATVMVTPVDDTEIEPNETVVVTISANAAYAVGTASFATVTIADNDAPTQQVLPALLVIANRDFYFQEYADTRASLEQAGITVTVAAAERTLATPHSNSGQGTSSGTVLPDVALRDARAGNFSTIIFVGGWGSSAYQFGFTGTYTNAAYNGSTQTHQVVNNLINDFVRQGKYVAAICHGVSVLAWARIDTNGNGVIDAADRSPIAGRSVVAFAGSAPASNVAGSTSTRWHVESNGATMLPSRSVGNASTDADDVLVDGRFITAENYNSAREFGRVIAQRLRG
jgi:putative intracellular protease/amidase